MKMLVSITDAVWISPDDLVAVVDLGGKTMILLSGAEPVTVHHITPDDVLDKVQAALREVASLETPRGRTGATLAEEDR